MRKSSRAFPGAGHRLADAVHAALRVRERPVLLGEARGREDDVGELPVRVVQEEVLRDDEVEVRHALLDVVGVRLGLHGVLADQVERADPPVVEAGHDLVEPVAGRRGTSTPQASENFARISGSSTGW